MYLNSTKRRFSVTLTEPYIERLDRLVHANAIYLDHQDAIRDALRRLFKYHGMEPLYNELVEEADEPVEES